MSDHPDRLSVAAKLQRMVEMHAAGCSLADLKGCLETTLAHVEEKMREPAAADARAVDAILNSRTYSGKGPSL